ncbi:MAG: phytanoyl-CoA dioxygenase family protein [Candidatus Hydrogenedentes bacterium]|nr:phytanoyl-CoA dioxygenase family protein [Candidatus Hydrogenedentota bacterium]
MHETAILSADELAAYNRDGYLVHDELLSPAECDALLERAAAHVACPRQGIAVQLEPALENKTAPNDLRAVRKIEGLVQHDDLFRKLAVHPLIFTRIQAIVGNKVRMFRDALMMKPAHHGSAKPYHQDSAYWNIKPMDLCSIWVALEDATVANGCMRVLPGTHRELFEHKHLEDFRVPDEQLDLSSEVIVPLKKGGVLFFHSLVLHATPPNTSDTSRRAMVVSYMGAECKWTGAPAEESAWLALN